MVSVHLFGCPLPTFYQWVLGWISLYNLNKSLNTRAIAMKKNDVKHIFFVAETKGSMSSMDLSAIERAKIDCAEKLFNSISTANVKYHKVATYQDLIDGMHTIS